MKKYKNELLHVLANNAVDSADMKSLLQERYDNVLGYVSGLTDEELEEYCDDTGVDSKLYLKEEHNV